MPSTKGSTARKPPEKKDSMEVEASASAASDDKVAAPAPAAAKYPPTDQAVLDYLKKKGMGTAVLELTTMLNDKKMAADDKTEGDDTTKSARQRLEEEETKSRNQRSLLTKSTGGGYGYDRDSTWQVLMWGIPDAPDPAHHMGADEARAFCDAFVQIQLWVLSLPDADGLQILPENPLQRAQELLKQASDSNQVSLQSVVKELAKPTTPGVTDEKGTTFNLPPSAKPELLAVTFALFVHTYCELLEVGMETTAHTLRDAFEPLYEPLYKSEFRDLYQCQTTEDIMKLNTHNSQHMEALNTLKSYLVQMASYQLRRGELNAHSATGGSSLSAEQEAKILEYDRNIALIKQKYSDLSKRVAVMFNKLSSLPFLRRARAVRWQLTMSNATYSLLMSFLNARDDSLLAMSTLLQTKCELHVERRDPLPFTPACVLDESKGKELELNKMDVNWAAPMPRRPDDAANEELPFPKFHLDEEYDTEKQAARDKRTVKFNRALLVNGFRRLEALERKREYEVMPASAKKLAREGYHHNASSRAAVVDPLEPSILLSTLCASSSGPVLRPTPASGVRPVTDASAIWEESGIGLCCVKLCPPDGRRIAVGCDDSAIRIWDAMNPKRNEPCEVLLGHKNGFPVFDVDWNRDGRTLLSCGGDGSVRLWDTTAVGPFGELTTPKPGYQGSINAADSNQAKAGSADMEVPGLRPENAPYSNGAALVVYRGHAPSAPVWSVAFAPSGYYFASTGADSTARLWTTDRPVPVRLFTGHTASNVNCVEWHPNCNYIVTGCDDKTVRMWDIQTGRTVRLLNGCPAGINAVKVSPGGRYVAGADHTGIVHLWDLGTGKKVTEFRAPQTRQDTHVGTGMIHALDFSACGTALATGGDSCTVCIWDVRAQSLEGKPLLTSPVKSYATRHTLIMDLQFTKRNLLLSVGKVANPVPLRPPNE